MVEADAEAVAPTLPPLLLEALSAASVRAAIARADSNRRREPTAANASERETSDGGPVPATEWFAFDLGDCDDDESMRDCAEAVAACAGDTAVVREDLPSLLAADDNDDDDDEDDAPIDDCVEWSCSVYARYCAARWLARDSSVSKCGHNTRPALSACREARRMASLLCRVVVVVVRHPDIIQKQRQECINQT